MQKRYIVLSILIIIGLVVLYLWYAHASIYWKLGAAGLSAPSDMHPYTLDEGVSSSTLTYAAIGDSLTAGVGVATYKDSYPYKLAALIANGRHEQVKVEPFAVPGVRTDYVIANFLDNVVSLQPDIITLLIGINDIHGKVPNATFKAHYNKILQRLTSGTHAHIYVVNLPYIGTPSLILPPYRLYFHWKTQQYNAIIKALATQYNVTYIDLYSAHAPNELNNAYYAEDHFHQNALGYTLWAQSIYAGFNH